MPGIAAKSETVAELILIGIPSEIFFLPLIDETTASSSWIIILSPDIRFPVRSCFDFNLSNSSGLTNVLISEYPSWEISIIDAYLLSIAGLEFVEKR